MFFVPQKFDYLVVLFTDFITRLHTWFQTAPRGNKYSRFQHTFKNN